MGMNLSTLLVLSPDVPQRAKEALLAATRAPAEERERLFLVAARELASSTALDCSEARAILGLADRGAHDDVVAFEDAVRS